MRTFSALLVALTLTGHATTGQEEDRKEERARILKREAEVVATQIDALKTAIAQEAAEWEAKVKAREARVASLKRKLVDSEAAARKIRNELATTGGVKKEEGYAEILKQLKDIQDRLKALEGQKKP
jgi:hypothetical protein